MFRNIDKEWFLPTEEEVANRAAENHRYEEPYVVGHDDQHEEVGNDQLHEMQCRLKPVRSAQDARLAAVARSEKKG